MGFSAIENNVINVDLVTQSNYTGWTIDGNIATHSNCQSGSMTLLNYPVIAGHTYILTYTILTISGGFVIAMVGESASPSDHTTPDIIVESITATNTSPVQFYSDANCTLELFNIQDITTVDPVTIVWSEENRKWSDKRSYNPGFGFSLIDTNGLMYHGALYIQQNGSDNRNNFFGVQYQSKLKFVEAKAPAELKTFNSIALQSNQLMVTTDGGITTNLGQVSSLVQQDFLKSALNDGVSSINVYSAVGIYSASFMRDQNQDIINGDQLAGNYIIIELITTDGSTPLQLFSAAVNTSIKRIGVR